MKMRLLVSLFLVMLLLTGTAMAAKPVINADKTYFDITSGLYVLEGNVYVEVGSRIVRAHKAKVSIGSLEVWATGGVTLTQDDITFTGGDVYVYGTQKRAQIDGGVVLNRNEKTIRADSVDFNWGTKTAIFTGNVVVNDGDNVIEKSVIGYDVANNKII